MPVPTRTFVTLIQLYSPLWNRLVFWVAGSSMKPSELMTAAKSMRTELLQVTSMTRASLPKAFAHARPTRRQIIGNYWRPRRFTQTPAHFLTRINSTQLVHLLLKTHPLWICAVAAAYAQELSKPSKHLQTHCNNWV